MSRIDSASGLSHNSVYAVLRDRQGFVWVGTPDGLNRYDGYEVRRFYHDPDDPTSLSNQVVRCLLEDREGNLWIGTGDSLNLLDRTSHRFHRIRLGAEGGGRQVLSLFEDRRGTLWVGTNRSVFRRDRTGHTFTLFATAGNGDVRDFAESPEGVIWALVNEGTESTLYALDGSGRALAVDESWGWVTNFGIDSGGRFWLKPPLPARIDPSSHTLQPTAPPDRSLLVNRVRAGNDDVWMATEHGLCQGWASAGVSCRAIDSTASWLHNFVRDIWIDDEGAVWFGTYTGLSRFDPAAKPFETWGHDERDPHTLSSDAVSAIVEGKDGALWVGTFGGGLNRLDRTLGEATRFRSVPGDPTSLPHDTVWALLLDPEDILWIGTEAGLASFDAKKNRFTRPVLPFPADERIGRRTTALARDPAGVLWIEAAGGLYSYDPRTHASRRYVLPRAQEVPENVAAILADEDGTLWTGTSLVGLRRFDPKTGAFEDFPRLTKQQTPLSSEGFWDIHSDGRGAFWIATGMGLSRFDRSTGTYENFLPRDGLPASMIYSIAEDRRGRLWLGTSRGLVRFDRAAIGERRFRTFEPTDGIAALEFNRHAATRTHRGELCFGGIGGLTCFDPERIEDDRRPPRVVLTGIELAEGPRTIALEPFGREEIELRHDNDPFGFTFAALSFANPRKNLYQYRLEGFDRGWIEAGTRHLARYTNVPPGEYLFRVRGSNSDLTWNREGASIHVRILPPFWMTWWFRVLIVAIVASLLYGIYRYRVSRLIEMERLRLRIASDLHDDVTSELSGISMLVELVRRRLPQDPAAAEQLGSLRDRTTALASVMRDLAWGIHPEHDTAGSMIRRMRSTGAMLLGDTPLRVEVQRLEESTSVPMLLRRTLFLLYKEGLHNAAKHAHAGEVRVLLRSIDHALEMTVSDDGAGFDPTAAHAGDGLRNMRRRVSDAGGEIEIQSEPGAGTTIVVRLPLRTARGHEDS